VPGTNTERSAVFGPVASSAGAARRFLRHKLEELHVPEPPAEATVLLTNELISNAVLHARTDMELRLSRSDQRVRVEVHDGNTRQPSAAVPPQDATSGRGLLLVEALADRWGIEGTTNGKVVWFELPIARIG
jgi:anti-sigma regulatory factor (Ser/Thr protein kinase)